MMLAGVCLEGGNESHSVVFNSLRPHGLYSPWNSPGQNAGVDSPFSFPADIPSPGIKPRSPALQADSFFFFLISWRLITSQPFSGFCHTLT